VAAQSPAAAATRRAARHAAQTEPEQDAPAAEPVVAPAARTTAPASGLMRAAQGTVAVIGKAARAVFGRERARGAAAAPEETPQQEPPRMPATGDIGEGLSSPGYVAAEHNFAGEARDGAWASAQEQRVRALLEPQAWSDHVAVLNCQQSTCRMVIETDSVTREPFDQLLAVPGLSDATGIASGTPYSLHNGQLALYFTPSALPGAEQASR
jgi:hypothetical protein